MKSLKTKCNFLIIAYFKTVTKNLLIKFMKIFFKYFSTDYFLLNIKQKKFSQTKEVLTHERKGARLKT